MGALFLNGINTIVYPDVSIIIYTTTHSNFLLVDFSNSISTSQLLILNNFIWLILHIVPKPKSFILPRTTE